VVAPVFPCDAPLGPVGFELPCELGMPPVLELDCTLTGAVAGQKLQMILPSSLPDVNGAPELGKATAFHAQLVPGSAVPMSGTTFFMDLSGTVTFASFSYNEQKFDGWFPKLT